MSLATIDFSQHCDEPFLLIHAPVVQEFAEYSQEPILSIIDKMGRFKELTRQEFREYGRNKFYEQNKTYIYDLLTANPSWEGVANKLNKFIPGLMDTIRAHPGKTFMEFGAGIGVMCQIIEQWAGKKVTYVDIKSPISDFARWRFAKHNNDIEMIIIPQDDFKLDRKFDIIFSDAVLEHLDPSQQVRYARKLADMVLPAGLFILIVDLQGESQEMPMHYYVNMRAVFDQLKASGLTQQFVANEQYPFASLWRRIDR
jgi:2-polyprenyl-3-methyl-5-hydroxy-6-metoxy-1,4-benzoquinol methylase